MGYLCDEVFHGGFLGVFFVQLLFGIVVGFDEVFHVHELVHGGVDLPQEVLLLVVLYQVGDRDEEDGLQDPGHDARRFLVGIIC